MAMNSIHVIFCQESWNLKHKLKVAGQHVGLNFGTALEILSIQSEMYLNLQTLYFQAMFWIQPSLSLYFSL